MFPFVGPPCLPWGHRPLHKIKTVRLVWGCFSKSLNSKKMANPICGPWSLQKSLEKIIHSFCDLNGNTFPILGHFVHEEIRTTGIMLFIERMARFVRQYLCDLKGVGRQTSGLSSKLSWQRQSGCPGFRTTATVSTVAADPPHEKDPELGGPVNSCSVLDNEIAVLAASAHIDVRS